MFRSAAELRIGPRLTGRMEHGMFQAADKPNSGDRGSGFAGR